MKSALKPSDSIARHGGDEFVLIIEQVASESDAAHVAQRMVDVLTNPFELGHGRCTVAASIGISLYPNDGEHPEVLLGHADEAMYRAKSEGRGLYRFYRAQDAASSWQMVQPHAVEHQPRGQA